MEITKEQIQYIDNRLKKEGIKYWDIRIEMVDHVVSDLEKNAKTSDFKIELDVTLKRIGWSGNLSDINRESWQNVNRYYRKMYHKGFVHFFKKFKNVSIFATSLLVFYVVSEMISFKAFKNLSFTLFVAPMLFVLIEFVKSLFKKYGRSVNLDYGFMYLLMSFLILNAFPHFFIDQTETVQKIVWFVILSVHFIAFYSGYHLYKKTILKVEEMRKQLLS
ncbi:hypothetical protein BTO04_09895 [Polaribacter sp. SA4-10]|uniref:hypothetical protein n=1 Tax=Polaribacter sp. SA4-10 TaxID=754397 RepID=UPI000B3C4EA3|nr:hypothetical protein [Polaribacter sp. SA4-10]ARV06978.1 hypothetical protein BTO04_09895 [Polaribacter sp. SA4-10]